MHRKGRAKKPGFFGRMFRSFFSIVILTAFVIAIALFVKEMSSIDSVAISRYTSPILNKLGMSGDDAGMVAGEFVERLSQTKINTQQNQQLPKVSAGIGENSESNKNENLELLFSVGLVADSGDENDMLLKAIEQAEAKNVNQIIHLGDLTAWGDVNSLQAAKEAMESSDVSWYVIPGDHDLADSVGQDNFKQVFGSVNDSFTFKGIKFLLLDNSANFTPIDSDSIEWFKKELEDADYVILSQPLYHPVNPRVMGIFDGEEDEQVRVQAELILDEIRNSNVKAIIAADHHKSSENPDPQRSSLMHYVVGSVATQRNLQRPRFSILKVYTNSEYDVDEVVIE